MLNNRYEIIKPLGSGGFGDTYLAKDTQMPSHRRCVIKQLKPVTNNPQIAQLVQERFGREAAILESLGAHPQIPQLYAYFIEGGNYYLVQKWIEGSTLTAQMAQQGTMRESDVREILTSLLPVLEFVHNQQIVHRDIKPDNIILRAGDNQPVLIDFGAVKETMGTVVNSVGNATSSIVIGTPGFMPSEQAAGRPIYSSDLYAVGVTAIYLLTGKWPQELQTDYHTGEIVWQNQVPLISPTFAAVLDKAIKSHPKERYHTAREMLAALQAPVYQPPPTVPSVPILEAPVYQAPPTVPLPLTPPPKGKGGWQGGAISGGIIAAAILLGMFLTRTPQPTATQQSVQSVNTPTPQSVNTPPPSPTISRPEPTQALRDYYGKINSRNYSDAWSQLSPGLRNNSEVHPEGYNSYLEWWTTVGYVDIISVNSLYATSDTAQVQTELQYLMVSGREINQILEFSLVWDETSGQWQVDRVRRL